MAGRMGGFLWLGVAVALLVPTGGAGQGPQSDWLTETGIGAANVLVGGLTTAVTAWIRGEDVGNAFVQGSVGGAGVFVGKRVARERFDGAGLLGRQVAAVGSSVAANGGMGRGWLEEVWLPVGPLWVQASPGSAHDLRLDLSNVAALAWAGTRPELEFDWGQSLSTGAAIFVARKHRILHGSDRVNGFALPGGAVLGVGSRDPDEVRAHEMVHVIQQDYLRQNVSRPVEAWGWRLVLDRPVPIDLGVAGLLTWLPFVNDLIEAEAYRLTQ